MSLKIPTPSTLPPPPPPAPPFSSLLADKNDDGLLSTRANANNDTVKTCYESKCVLGIDEALVQVEKICRFELELSNEEGVGMLAVVQPLLQPIAQNGPVCGLVALVEAGEVLGMKLNPDDVLAKAVEMEVTKKGEMFSCEAMKSLAETFQFRVSVFSTRDQGTFAQLVSHCLRGKPVLVPYDADRNHSPSMRKGHAAHWATIHGIATKMSISVMRNLFKGFEDIGDDSVKILCCGSKETSEKFKHLVASFEEDTTYVVAHQGKSYKTAIWEISELIRSNQNLHEISPKIINDSDSYKLYDIEEGLCSKILVLDNNKN